MSISRSMSIGLAFFVVSLVTGVSMVAKVQSAEPIYVQITTTAGNIVLELDQEKAPISVENFLDYVKRGHYEGTVFHRVVKDFMIQGGGFDKGDLKTPKSTGKGIKNEAYNGLSNTKYTLAMARTSDPNSATSQFFINVSDRNARFLDRASSQDGFGYTVFGKVVKGKSVVDAIALAPVKPAKSARDEASEPVDPVVIEKAEIVVPVNPQPAIPQ